jgi:hypothetical protein
LPTPRQQPNKQAMVHQLNPFSDNPLVESTTEKNGLMKNNTLMSPDIAKSLHGLDDDGGDSGVGCTSNHITDPHNTVGFLVQYAERIFPANIYQEFLQSKNRLKKKYPAT